MFTVRKGLKLRASFTYLSSVLILDSLSRSYSTTSISITDPLVIYKTHVAHGVIQPDVSQQHIAMELQKLYYQLKDYQPELQNHIKINRIIDKLNNLHNPQSESFNAIYSTLFKSKDSKQLVKLLSNEDELETMNVPRGLYLTGGIGSGKSMLVSMFLSSLPYHSKKQWSFNNFVSWLYYEINCTYQAQQKLKYNGEFKDEIILFQVAEKMMQMNTILVIDGFNQLNSDLTSVKIMKILFMYFFKLGGILITTSSSPTVSGNINGTHTLMNIINKRCNYIKMQSNNNYRFESLNSEITSHESSSLYFKQTKPQFHQKLIVNHHIPLHLFKRTSSNIESYGRRLNIPSQYKGSILIQFSKLCEERYSLSDILALTSQFHTFIIDDVPELKETQKDDVNRFINLIDCLYDAKCQLIINMVNLDIFKKKCKL